MSQTNNDKDFKMTKEELDKFEKALKDEEFRKLLVEYAQEISDPENKKKYEEEIAEMEKMRGMDVKFVNPEDGYVVKTTDFNSGAKVFVNICTNQHIGQASSQYMEKEENGQKKVGQQWNIPYSISQPRDDFDRAGKKCVVYDAVFHPDTYKKGQQDKRFKQLMIDTALDGIQRQFKVTLDKNNLKFPKMTFKGVKTATVIRTKTKEVSKESAEFTVGGQKFPYPYNDEPTALQEEKQRSAKSNKKQQKPATDPTVPEYRIVHRGHIDLQNFTYARDSNANTRPKELVIYIDLPKLESAAPVDLDILEKQLVLTCKKPPYHLDLALPYPVDEENGSAKFDKSKRRLIVTLPVLPPPMPNIQAQTDEEAATEEQIEEEEGHKSSLPVEDDNNDTANINLQNNTASSGEMTPPDDSAGERLDTMDVPCEKTNITAERNEKLQPENTDVYEVTDDVDIRFKLSNSSSVSVRGGPTRFWSIHSRHNPFQSDFSSPCFFICPPYNYHQDTDIITFIIDVANVALDSVSLGFNKNKAYISFPSGTNHPGELPSPDYALYLQFPDDHDLDTELCNIDVSEENLVLTLHKLEACKGLWDSFQAGSGEENLEIKFFITDKAVDLMMKEIANQDPWAAPNGEANVKVSSFTDDCLSLEVETNLKESGEQKPLGFYEKSDKRHMGDNISSCEEVSADLAHDLQRTKINAGDSQLNKAGSEVYEKEQGDSDAALAEKEDNFVPIDVISDAVRTRRSILRRTSSTSTDESLADENEFNGTPESPSKKNVRFNMNPNVRVFSNKKDKKKRKLEAKLKAEARKHSLESEGSGSELSNGTSPVDEGTGWNGFGDQSRGKGLDLEREGQEESKINCANSATEPVTSSKRTSDSFGLTNNLIFELDD